MVKLYRAQPISGISPRTALSFLDQLYGGGKTSSIGGTGLQGQYFTTDPARARSYMPSSFQKFSYFDPKLGPKFMGFGEPMGAKDLSKSITTKPGIIKSMNLSDADFEKVKSFTKKVPTLPGYQFAYNLPNEFLVPKTFLKNRNPSINLGQTLKAYGDRGLSFLKNNAFRTLAMLGTLPAQAGIMSLSPTRMGNAELPQMPKGPPSIINQGGGGSFDTSRGDKAGTSLGSGQFSPKTSRGRSGYGIGGLV